MQDDLRTKKQNDSLHLWFDQLAQTLNDAGLDLRVVLKPEAELPWNRVLIKELLWRPIQKIVTRKKSTTRLTRKEMNDIHKIIETHLAKKFGVLVDFPSIETLINKNDTEN